MYSKSKFVVVGDDGRGVVVLHTSCKKRKGVVMVVLHDDRRYCRQGDLFSLGQYFNVFTKSQVYNYEINDHFSCKQ